MMTPEGKVKLEIRKLLKQLKCWTSWPTTTGFSTSGDPDVIFLYRGKFFGIEAKAPGRRRERNRGCSSLQTLRMTEIEASGGRCFVVDSKEEIDLVFREVQDAIAIDSGHPTREWNRDGLVSKSAKT